MNNYISPVFIVGTPRSGTTLLRLIIDSHPEIAITPESSFLFRVPSLWNALYPKLDEPGSVQAFIDDLRSLPQVKDWLPKHICAEKLMGCKEELNTLSDFLDALFSYYAQTKGKLRWGDKSPKNLHAIDEIMDLFPSAKIVIMMRDCRDVAMSLSRAEFSRVSYISAAKRWQLDADIAIQNIQKNSDQIYFLKYEDLLEDPDKIIKSLLDFLNLSEYPEILKIYAGHEDDVTHTKSLLYMKPIQKDNIYKWKKYMSDQEVTDCEAIAKVGMEYFGYEVLSKTPTISRVKVFIQSVKDVTKLIRNNNNMENYYVYGKLSFKRIFQKFVNR